MKKYIALSVAVIAAMVFTGCATSNHQSMHSSFQPDQVRLNIGVQDMECIGETEISISEDIYFGLFKSTREVNGQKYDSWNKKTTSLYGATWGHKAIGLNKATSKVVEMFPDADLYQVVRESSKVERMFGMRAVTRTALVKAYKLKK